MDKSPGDGVAEVANHRVNVTVVKIIAR